MEKATAIKRINDLSQKTFNDSQKQVAIEIINSAKTEIQVAQFYNLIIQKVKIGFKFDEAAMQPAGIIGLVENNEKLTIDSGTIDNKFIIGENLDALKNLRITHKGLIDIIYIDPPYNTESSNDDGNHFSEQEEKEIIIKTQNKHSTFLYRDKFSRTGWLNLMKERLEIAKDLLSELGVIFVSIDDNEQAYLKVLMDEIFGEENFIANIANIIAAGAKNDSKLLKKETEYILFYRKTTNFKFLNRKYNNSTYKDIDEKGEKYKWKVLDHSGRITYSKSFDYKIDSPIGSIVAGGDMCAWKLRQEGKNFIKDWCWPISKETFEKLSKQNDIKFEVSKKGFPKVFRKKYLKDYDGAPFTNHINFLNSKGTAEIEEIFGNKIFETPKPTTLIMWLIQLIPNNENAIILDFFAGSATTGHAVMKLNFNDNGKREFILVSNNEGNISTNIAIPRLKKLIKHEIEDCPDFSNNNLVVFDLKYQKINFSDTINDLSNNARKNFKLLNKNFVGNDEKIYYSLASLRGSKTDEIN